MPPKPKFKRKHYFIAPAFQLRYIRTVLLIVFGVGVLSAYTVYYQSMILFGEKLANVYPQGRLVSIVKSINMQILLSLLLITPLMVLIGMFLSHRIAGPIYRMEKFLTGVSQGDLTTHLTLRPKDELKPLAEGINTVVDSLRSSVAVEKKILDNLRTELSNLEAATRAKPVEESALKSRMDRLREEIANLSTSISRYKL